MDSCLIQCQDKQIYTINTRLPQSFWMLDMTFSGSVIGNVYLHTVGKSLLLDEISKFHGTDRYWMNLPNYFFPTVYTIIDRI